MTTTEHRKMMAAAYPGPNVPLHQQKERPGCAPCEAFAAPPEPELANVRCDWCGGSGSEEGQKVCRCCNGAGAVEVSA